MKVAITIPAFNEEQTLGPVLQDIKKIMDVQKQDYFIAVVNDGSTDKTEEIAKAAGAHVVSHPYNCGLAEAFKTEIKACLQKGADVIVHTDADGQYSADDILKLLHEIKNGYDLVLGSRFLGKIERMPFTKRLGNVLFSRAISHITRVKITDAQTGFRAFTKQVAKLDIISSHTYTQEQIIRAIKNKYKIKEVPVDTKETRPSRLMRSPKVLQPFEYAAKAWINIFRIYRDFEPLKFFGYIAGIFFAGGFVLGSALLYNFFTSGKIGHLPAVVLTMLLVVASIQIFLFGFLADMNKKA